MSNDKHLRCSFCGKSKESVKKFISGPSVYICNECISLCNEILAEEEERESQDAAGRPRSAPRRDQVRSSTSTSSDRRRRSGRSR